jgi:hypothetical protein
MLLYVTYLRTNSTQSINFNYKSVGPELQKHVIQPL